jgi:uncharacterized protein (DUF1015 family)
MAILRPFRAVRPANEYAAEVAAPPYDVMTSEEARLMVLGKPNSFLHIDRAEVDLPASIDPYDDSVYQKAKENLSGMIADGVLIEDSQRCFYIYRLIMGGHVQTGVVGCASIDDYLENRIRKHELTRPDKEIDRTKHVDRLDANTGPIFMTCRPNEALAEIIASWTGSQTPIYDFTADDGIKHIVWRVEGETAGRLEDVFKSIDFLYIADGHHRCASAVNVGLKRREANHRHRGDEEYNFFLSVIFPSDQLNIMDYNRTVKDLGGNSKSEFLEKLSENFTIESYEGAGRFKPEMRREFGLYLDGVWYKLTLKPGVCKEDDLISQLDVSILQDQILEPILGIKDPRVDERIDFIGGIRGLEELERRVMTDMKAAFALYPTTLDELMDIADAGLMMPPKSTWFEPKLRSGLFIHPLESA